MVTAPTALFGMIKWGSVDLLLAEWLVGPEFDLSIGSMVAFSGLIFGAFVVTFGMPLVIAIPATFAIAAALGAVNGTIVLKTGLPSFIVTLAFLFILRGASLVGLKIATGGSTADKPSLMPA